MIDLFFEFFSLADPNVRYVLAGTILLGLSAGSLGCFAVLRERALVGDAVAHAVLPGVCLAFIVAGDKNPYWLLMGSLFFGWLSMLVMDIVIRNSKISPDASIGMVLSVFFGLGVVMLTYIQSTGNVNQSGLDAFLFGNAASMLPEDVYVFGFVSLIVLICIAVAYKELKMVSFDPQFAKSLGYPVKRLEFLIATLLVVTITAGLQAVGVVLMASMLIIPAAAARYWTDTLHVMVITAGVFGALAAVSGSWISYSAPAMPTGPWMVVSAAIIFAASFLFAPKRGEVGQWFMKRKNSRKVNEENVLKTLYHLEEADGNQGRIRTEKDVLKRRNMKESTLRNILKKLEAKKLVTCYQGSPNGYLLTENGRQEAARVVRVHRLWELYLTERLEIKGDHVHDDAESMEHVITPEIEERLAELLGHPVLDPHKSRIPYGNPKPKEG